MNRSDRARWKRAVTAADLGGCVIAWLNGEIRETPSHGAPPDPETIPLIPALTLINRAGLITENSQLAESDGRCTWNAWVSGFASDDVLARLRGAIARTPLDLAACRRREHECGRWWLPCPWRSATGFWAGRCPRAADEIYRSWYVSISDPEPGRNDRLWDVLARIGTTA